MREYLFRGKRIDNSEWIEGSLIIYDWDNNYVSIYSTEEEMAFQVDPETVGQYTGLTDKNGKKIFEGDVFKFDDEVWEGCNSECGMEWGSWAVENYAVVGFDEDESRYDFVRYKYNENSVRADLHENHDLEFSEFVEELEVIGNIHDNPELLEGVEE